MLTFREVLQQTGLSERTVRRRLREGVIRIAKRGRGNKYYFNDSVVEALRQMYEFEAPLVLPPGAGELLENGPAVYVWKVACTCKHCLSLHPALRLGHPTTKTTPCVSCGAPCSEDACRAIDVLMWSPKGHYVRGVLVVCVKNGGFYLLEDQFRRALAGEDISFEPPSQDVAEGPAMTRNPHSRRSVD